MRSILPRSFCSILFITSFVFGGGACVDAEDELDFDDEALGESTQAIEDGTAASAFQLARAADLVGCTGTRISPRHVLTALHCVCIPPSPDSDLCISQLGNPVRFYTTGPASTSTSRRTITRIMRRPGTLWTADDEDWTDSNGDFADLAIFELNADVTIGSEATLAWSYPGSDRLGIKVGAGTHENLPNGSGILLQRSDRTYSDDASGGGFLTNQDGANKGDSGGPFYVGTKVVGTLTGAILDGVWRGRHTSVPHHLDWILTQIGFSWGGEPVQSGVVRSGTIASALIGPTERVCQYACEKTASCDAYNYLPGVSACYLLSSVTGATNTSGWHSAVK